MSIETTSIPVEHPARALVEVTSQGLGISVEEIGSRAVYAGLDLVVEDIKRGLPDRYSPLNRIEGDDYEERMERGRKKAPSKLPKNPKSCSSEDLLKQATIEIASGNTHEDGSGRSLQRFWPAVLKWLNDGKTCGWIFDWCAARDDYLTEDRRAYFVSSMNKRYRKHQELILSYSDLYSHGLRLSRKLDEIRNDPDYRKAMAHLSVNGGFEVEHEEFRKFLKRAYRRDRRMLQFDDD